MRRSLLTLACIASFSLAGCAIIVAPGDGDLEMRTVFSKDAVQGDGRLSSERRTIASLNELDMSGPVHVDVRVGQAPSLVVEADSNLLPLVRTEAAGNTLRVWVQGNVRTNNPIRVTYTVPQLAQIRATGSGRLAVTDLNGGALTVTKTGSGETMLGGRVGALNIKSTGSGNVNASGLQSGNTNLSLTGSGGVNVGRVSAEALNVKLHGSGDLQASGAAEQLNAQVTGSGGINLTGLASQRADLTTDGSGDITARVTQSLVAQTNGSGRITVYGNPAQRQVTGKRVQVLN